MLCHAALCLRELNDIGLNDIRLNDIRLNAMLYCAMQQVLPASAACAVREIAAERASIGVFAMGAAHVASLRTACHPAMGAAHVVASLCYAMLCNVLFALPCCAVLCLRESRGDRCRKG